MPMKSRIVKCLAIAAVMAVAAAACNRGDQIAPEGSTIDLAATPTNVVLIEPCPDPTGVLGAVQKCGTSDVVATVSSSVGVPLRDQDVRFTSTAGFLFTGSIDNPENAANVPIRTDSFGNATVSLITSTTTTVNARSGKASGTLTLSTVDGNLSQILLNLDTVRCPGTTTSVTRCDQQVCFIARAEDTNGDPISGLVIVFELQNNVSLDGNVFNVVFDPSQKTTAPPTASDPGTAATTMTPSSTCPSDCGGNKNCTAEVVAKTQGGIKSIPIQLQINIQ